MVSTIPNYQLKDAGPYSKAFIGYGLTDFHSACRHIQKMPYGSNSSDYDPILIFEEGAGNSKGKHGAVAALAQEQGLPVYRFEGFYRLSEKLIPGVNKILTPFGLPFIPFTHSFLGYKQTRVDLTEGNDHGKLSLPRYYELMAIVPAKQSISESREFFRWGLTHYRRLFPMFNGFTDDELILLIDQCARVQPKIKNAS